MKLFPPNHRSNPGFRRFASGLPAIGWALMSQSIWLPLLLIDAHDRWQTRVRELKPEVASLETPAGSNALSSKPQAGLSPGAGPLLASGDRNHDPLLNLTVDRSLDVSTPSSPTRSRLTTPASANPSSQAAAQTQRRSSTRSTAVLALASPGRLRRAEQAQAPISRSPILVPSLRLMDRGMPQASQLAMANRVSSTADHDPLASLPSAWREPMRRALKQLPATKEGSSSVHAARVIYVPSTRISAPATVPLAMQPDGSLDIFSRPADPVVIEELRNWSNRQPQAEKGVIRPVVVHLTPLPSGTTAMVSAPSAAADALRQPAPAPRAATRPAAQVPRRTAVLPPPPPLPPLPSQKAVSPAPPAAEAIATPAPLSPKRDVRSTDREPTSAPSQSPAASAISTPDPVPAATPNPVAAVTPQAAVPVSSAPSASSSTTSEAAQ